jgi:hypothetical protein
MDLIRKLTELNHRTTIREELEKRYPLNPSKEDIEEELKLDLRNKFMLRYDKVNNRQFVVSKSYPIEEYRKHVLVVDIKQNTQHPNSLHK